MGLGRIGYYNWTVDHTQGFVDPILGHHTNTIEGLWALIRGDLRTMRGISKDDLQTHLDVFAFRRNIQSDGQSVWTKMCMVIGAMQGSIPKPSF